MGITRWSIPKSDWLYYFQPKMEKLYTVSKKPRLWADCGSDRELLIVKFRHKLKTVGKITRPFRFDLNLIPYDFRVEVTNRFKGLDLIESLKNYGWRFMTLNRGSDQDHPQQKEMQKKKQNDCLRRPYKYLWKEEKQKSKEKREAITIWMQTSKE